MAYIVRVRGCPCVLVHIYVCSSPQIKKKTINRMPRSLPFISTEKNKQVYKNIFAKGHNRQSNTLRFHFRFVLPPSLSIASLSFFPPLLSQSRLSSFAAFPIRQTEPVLLSQAA